MAVSFRFRVLGPLEVAGPHGKLPVTGRKTRILLATLLLDGGGVVPAERLVDAIWGGRPPRNARKLVHVCVSRLRARFAAAGAPGDVISTNSGGYRVKVEDHDLDLLEFRRLRDEADAAAAQGSLHHACGRYRAALDLWRGAAGSGIDSDLVSQAARSLEEERMRAVEERMRLELSCGRAGELVPELTELVQQHPYRERLHAALILALYRGGRQADALAAYRHVRRVLHDELGSEPGPELRRLHRAILDQEPNLERPPPATSARPTPRELPADVVDFTGRGEALRALDRALADGVASGHGPVVAIVTGAAGVGKTALAVHWAHRVSGEFPDGQLHLNLRGYAFAPPLGPVEALAALLRSLGTPPDQIPADEDQAANLYRSRLADRRVLVVLDNARSVDQVRPLLPGSPGCLVLVTSRDRLAGLVARGARRIGLDVFAPDDAHALLAHLIGAPRVNAEPAAAAALASACAYLPLALRVAAAGLVDHPRAALAPYAAGLVAGNRLSALELEGDQQSAVRTAFDLSYQRIPADAQKLFRLLGLIPGPDFTPEVAAVLIDAGAEPQHLLDRLASAHLVTEHAPDRYTLHDLLRSYARERAQREDGEPTRHEVTTRLLGWYYRRAAGAADLLYPDKVRLPDPAPEPEPSPMPFDEPGAALAWLDAEYPNLIAAIHHAAQEGPRALAWLLVDSVRGYLWVRRHLVDWFAVTNAALAAAEDAGDLAAQAAMNSSLGTAFHALRRYPEARDHSAAAADLAHRANWDDGEGGALLNLGVAHIGMGQFERASACLERGLMLNERAGRHATVAAGLGNLGYLCRQTGRLADAAEYCGRQVAMVRTLPATSVQNLARSLANQACVEHDLGRFDSARKKLIDAVAMYRDAGDRRGEALALEALAESCLEAGQLAEAAELAGAAVALATEIDDPRVDGQAHATLGLVRARSGRHREALDCHERALARARQVHDPDLEIRALIQLAGGSYQQAHHEEAADRAEHALHLAQDFRYAVLEGRALTVLARIRLGQDKREEAAELARLAWGRHRETGYRLGEARTLAVLGDIADADGDPDRARRDWQAAHDLFGEIGAQPDPSARR